MRETYKVIPAVFALVCEKHELDTKILLQRRKNTGYRDGFWDAPSGHVEEGELAIEACTREVKEEVCLTVNPADLALRAVIMNIIETPNCHYQYSMFEVDRNDCKGEPRIGEPEKCDKIEWFWLSRLPENLTPQVRLATESIGQSDKVIFTKITPDLL